MTDPRVGGRLTTLPLVSLEWLVSNAIVLTGTSLREAGEAGRTDGSHREGSAMKIEIEYCGQ